jgi:methyltransferase family protein
VLLSHQRIRTMIDIGSWSGWTAAFYAAYLRRFEPTLKIVSVDRKSEWNSVVTDAPFAASLPIEWRLLDTQRDVVPHDLRQGFDLAMIDAGHSYDEATKDWLNFGVNSRCTFFHDVNDDPIIERYAAPCRNMRTCAHLWQELKADATLQKQKVELFQHPSGKNLMGIGLLLAKKP